MSADSTPGPLDAFLNRVVNDCINGSSGERVFADGNPGGCKCNTRCEMPCWQRVGLTSEKCCAGCPPLPAVAGPPCETCDGNGEVQEACGRDQFGVWETDTWPCPDCHGTGVA